MLLGLPLLAALLVSLLDTAILRLAQRPLLREQKARYEQLEQKFAASDLTVRDDDYLFAMQSEKLRSRQELESWQRDHELWLRMDSIQLLPSIAFWVVYFVLLARFRRKDSIA